ncbi:MAG TPA: hypothetical protein VHP58_06190 [Alphaproteobacteria bacterium]|nr:hypothetical protein [Alphaproteobacteria bacterium]
MKVHSALIFKNSGLASVSRRYRRLLARYYSPEEARVLLRMLLGKPKKPKARPLVAGPVREVCANRTAPTPVALHVMGPKVSTRYALVGQRPPRKVVTASAEAMRGKYGLKKPGPAQTPRNPNKVGKAQKMTGDLTPWQSESPKAEAAQVPVPEAFMLPRHNKTMRPHDLRAARFS